MEVAAATWLAPNGAMDASKPWTRAWDSAATASRERDSVPLPTEEVAVIVWALAPAEAGVPREHAGGRVEGEARGQGGRGRPGDRIPGGVGEGEGGCLAHEELGGGRARDDGGLEDRDGQGGRVGAVAGVGVHRVGGLGGGLRRCAADGAGGRVEGEARREGGVDLEGAPAAVEGGRLGGHLVVRAERERGRGVLEGGDDGDVVGGGPRVRAAVGPRLDGGARGVEGRRRARPGGGFDATVKRVSRSIQRGWVGRRDIIGVGGAASCDLVVVVDPPAGQGSIVSKRECVMPP